MKCTPAPTRALRRVAALLALAALAGCRSDTYRLSTTLDEGARATLRILGDHPHVRFETDGPGTLAVHVEGPEGFPRDAREMQQSTGEWAYSGPLRFDLECRGPGPSVLRVVAKACDGLAMDAEPAAALEFEE